MRPPHAKLTTTTFLLMLAFTSVSIAQMQDHAPIKVTIPFDFVAADSPLPAGAYTIKPFQSDLEIISGKTGQIVTMAPPILDGAPGSRGLLIFHQVGQQYFLAEVWPAGSKRGRMIGGAETARRRMNPAITTQVTVMSGHR
jgi:hypothetical protein